MQQRILSWLGWLGLLAIVGTMVGCDNGRRRGGGDDDDSASNASDDADLSSDDDDLSPDDDDAIGDDDDAIGDDDDASGDSDGDGLSDSFEGEIGTDPHDMDSDGDGFNDGVEQLSYFFPDDSSDWPYLGDYPRQPIPRTVSSSGSGLGLVPSNFTSTDQHGQDISLHRFYGNVVVVELAAEW